MEDSALLEMPEVAFNADTLVIRPELQLYNSQLQLIHHQNNLINARNMPKASLFVEGGYGRPGLNLLKNEFDFFYIGGVRFNWSLGGLYTVKKDKQLTQVNRDAVELERETFLLNTNMQLSQQRSEVDKYHRLIDADQAIIDLRADVKNASVAQLANGVITVNDYLRVVSDEDQARQSLITHRIQLLAAQINYQTTLGKQ